MSRFLVLPLLLVSLVLPAAADAAGALYLERFFERPDPGVAPAQLYVYTDDGTLIHSGRGSGAYPSGERVELEEGWYWVEVGRYRTEHNLQRMYVAEGQTTVVPSGWVSVATDHPDEQPPGCDGWNAELTAFRVDEQGNEYLVTSNRGTGVAEFGMVQLPVGDFTIYFNQFPVQVTVEPGRNVRLATGYQGQVAGERPQIAVDVDGRPGSQMRSLCEAGPTHVPAGSYWVSRIVPTNRYPYEERIWDPVVVPPSGEYGSEAVRAERVSRIYDGDGSQPAQVDPTDERLLGNYRSGAVEGVRDSGFGGALPSLDL